MPHQMVNNGVPHSRVAEVALAGAAAAAGVIGWAVSAALAHTPFPVSLKVVALAAALATAGFTALSLRRGTAGLPDGPFWLALAAAGAWALALMALHGISFYLRFPVDFLGFWEGDYIGDLIKLRAGIPLYTDPLDNNSSVYTPGAQLLTYGIARLLGHELSIPFLRTVQFSYAIAAAAVATGACHQLARRFLRPEEYSGSVLWMALWFPLLVLVATEPRFNSNVHQLHPDSLTLLVSAAGFWLLARHLRQERPGLVWAMALLPAIGFWAKQSLLIWGVLFAGYLLATGPGAWRRTLGFGGLAAALLAASLVLLFKVGGPHTGFFVFGVLGAKSVALGRSFNTLLTAGGYAALALAGMWWLVAPERSRAAWAVWLVSALLFGIEAYTSGIGWQRNHLGPGVLIATVWFLAAVPRFSRAASRTAERTAWLGQASVAVGVILLFAGLGLVREPKDSVPRDTRRYIAAIEQEFAGENPRSILLDRGSWLYLPDTVLMKDRASSVQLHVGLNQAQVNRAMLVATIARIEAKSYRKILVRDLDHGSTYDIGNRGSGVKDALLANYYEVRRIPAVEIEVWWPPRLLADISVMVPRADSGPSAPTGAP